MHTAIRPLAALAWLVTLTPVAAQVPPDSARPPMDLQPHVYEVSPEHAAFLARARQAAEEQGFLEVSGTAQVSVPADRARVVFAVETEGRTAGQASTANADRMTEVLQAVRGTGAAGLSVETHGYTLQPEYARPTGEPRGAPSIVGYRAQNHVSATISEPDAVGGVIDAAIGAGANRVASLAFEASDTDAARQEALRMAVARARSEAQAMAEALGVPLGSPMEVRGGANLPGPGPQYRAAMMEAAVSTPVEPGQQVVTANVTIKYRLGGQG